MPDEKEVLKPAVAQQRAAASAVVTAGLGTVAPRINAGYHSAAAPVAETVVVSDSSADLLSAADAGKAAEAPVEADAAVVVAPAPAAVVAPAPPVVEPPEILAAAPALSKTTATAKPPTPPVPPAPKVKVYEFVKLFCPAEKIPLSDGTSFQFRIIQRNNQAGANPSSTFRTTDEKLAEKLREAAKVLPRGIRETTK